MLPLRFMSNRASFRQIFNVLKRFEISRSSELKCIHRQLHTTSCVSVLTPFKDNIQIQIKEREEPENTFIDPEDELLVDPDFFRVKDLVKLSDLFKARVHYGHKAGCRNEFMAEFLFGSRLNIDIFDLDKTLPMLHNALNFAAHIAYRQGVILFVSRHVQTLAHVEQTAVDCGEFSHCRYWRPGLFTNAARHYMEEIRMPDLVIMLHTKTDAFEEHNAIVDCAKMCIPTIAVVDSNCDPRLITYPIPGNDDTPQCIQFYLNLFKEAIKRGKDQREIDEKESAAILAAEKLEKEKKEKIEREKEKEKREMIEREREKEKSEMIEREREKEKSQVEHEKYGKNMRSRNRRHHDNFDKPKQ